MVSLATVLVMSLSILMIGSVIVGSAFASMVIEAIEAKVDVSAYFKSDAPESKILAAKADLERLVEVSAVKYVSRDGALADFRARHEGEGVILESLEVVGENPFSASLEIRAKDPSQYDSVSKFLESGRYDSILDVDEFGAKKITYRQNRLTIDRLTALLSIARKIGLVLGLVLAFVALVVAYSTVRLAIYNAKEEIAVMQLVGASRAFIRGPFLVEGVIHGLLSASFTLGVFYPVFWFAGQKTEILFGGLNVFEYFLSNIFQIGSLLFFTGILLGMLSAWIAIRRYLKV